MAEETDQLEAFVAAVIAYRDAICEEFWSNDPKFKPPWNPPSELAREKILGLYPKDGAEHHEYHLRVYRIMLLGKFRDDQAANNRLADCLVRLALALDKSLVSG